MAGSLLLLRFIDLKDRVTEGEREKQKGGEIFSRLFHSLLGQNDWAPARLTPGAWNSVWVLPCG